jgi:hypothetical protein
LNVIDKALVVRVIDGIYLHKITDVHKIQGRRASPDNVLIGLPGSATEQTFVEQNTPIVAGGKATLQLICH